MKNYLALLDYEHLENPIFLKSFAQSLAKHGARKGIVIHGDSEYTDRLIQTGMMREDARKRAIMDLNRRLIALLADHGVSALGLNAFQKELVSYSEEGLRLNLKALNSLPSYPVLVLSSLVAYAGHPQGRYVPPVRLAEFLARELEGHQITIFSQHEQAEILTGKQAVSELKWDELDEDFAEKHLSEEQTTLKTSALLTSSLGFAEWPDPKNGIFIR